VIDAVIVNIVSGARADTHIARRSPRMEELSFADAQARVRAVVKGPWEADGFGEFYIATYGSESPTH